MDLNGDNTFTFNKFEEGKEIGRAFGSVIMDIGLVWIHLGYWVVYIIYSSIFGPNPYPAFHP